MTYKETLKIFEDKLRIEKEFLSHFEKIAEPWSYALAGSRQGVRKLQKWVDEYTELSRNEKT